MSRVRSAIGLLAKRVSRAWSALGRLASKASRGQRLTAVIGVPVVVAALIATIVVGTAAPGQNGQDVDDQAASAAGAAAGVQCPAGPNEANLSASAVTTGEGEGGYVWEFSKLLLEGAAHFGEDEGLGWILSALTGEQGEKGDSPEIKEKVAEINSKLDALQQQVHDSCEAVSAKLDEVKNEVDLTSYQNATQGMSDTLGTLRTEQNNFQNLQADLGKVANADQLDPADMKHLIDFREGSDLTGIINKIDIAQTGGGQPGSGGGMIGAYSKVLTEELHLPEEPTASQIFASEFVNDGYDQMEFYAGALSQALYYYVEANHVSFTADGKNYPARPDVVTKEASDVQKMLTTWQNQFAGKTGEVIQRLPQDTVLDYRGGDSKTPAASPLLWTSTPLTLLGGSSSGNAREYCGTTAAFCYANDYDNDGHVVASALTTPSTASLPVLVASLKPGGIGNWQIPTVADWANLQHAATGGLGVYGPSRGLKMFAPDTVTGLYGGTKKELNAIAPVLVNTGTAAAPAYSVLAAGSPTVQNLTQITPPTGTQNALAGRVYLVQPFPKGGLAPTPTPKTQVSGGRTQSANKAATTETAATVGAQQSFSTPTVCSATSTYTVPAGANAVKIQAVGGDGANGSSAKGNSRIANQGGHGGEVDATIPAPAGTVLYTQVGGSGHSVHGGIGGGGNTITPSAGGDTFAGGGGGGFSGVSTTSDCSQWLVVAGGGGGGGGGGSDAGHGGTACAALVSDGGCEGAQAKDGEAFAGYSNAQGRAGGAAPNNSGGSGGRFHNAGGNDGTAGGNTTGGTGGGTPNGTDRSGGGGGGGYFGGGGGGGGGTGSNGSGGGGGGGNSFAVAGTTTPATFPTAQSATTEQNGSVTITPVLEPVMITSQDTGFVMNIAGASSADGTPIIQWARGDYSNEQWELRKDDNGGEQIVNPETGKCAAASSAQVRAAIVLQTCSTEAAQDWRIDTAPDGRQRIVSGLHASDGRALVLTADPNAPLVHGASLVVDVDRGAVGQRWTATTATWSAS